MTVACVGMLIFAALRAASRMVVWSIQRRLGVIACVVFIKSGPRVVAITIVAIVIVIHRVMAKLGLRMVAAIYCKREIDRIITQQSTPIVFWTTL